MSILFLLLKAFNYFRCDFDFVIFFVLLDLDTIVVLNYLRWKRLKRIDGE